MISNQRRIEFQESSSLKTPFKEGILEEQDRYV